MEANYSVKKQLTKLSLLALTIVGLTSCGSYQSVHNDDDGIYSQRTSEAKEAVVIENQESSIDYKAYFKKKREDYEALTGDDVFTDVETYSSNTEQAPVNPSWGANPERTIININVDPFFNSWNNWGWHNGYGWNRWNRGFGWNRGLWGWNASWGWNTPGWGWNNWMYDPFWGGGFGYAGFYGGGYWGNPYYYGGLPFHVRNYEYYGARNSRTRLSSRLAMRNSRNSRSRLTSRDTSTRTRRATSTRTRTRVGTRNTDRRPNITTRPSTRTRTRVDSPSRTRTRTNTTRPSRSYSTPSTRPSRSYSRPSRSSGSRSRGVSRGRRL